MPEINYEKKDKIAYITINRPEARNSLTFGNWDTLTKIWIDVRDDPDVWVAILTGTGDKAFSAGQDLKEVNQMAIQAEKEGRPLSLPYERLVPVQGILEIWKPFIVAINGLAYGGGFELAMACDIRIAAEHATFGVPEVKQSVIPTGGGTQRLPRLIPFANALEMLITGEPVDAQKALSLGLVNKVVPRDELMSTAEAMARRINENGPLAVRAVKEAATRGIRMPLQEGVQMEALLSYKVFQSEDAREGPRAFAEKRKPAFQGK